jgi:hypothetical protein
LHGEKDDFEEYFLNLDYAKLSFLFLITTRQRSVTCPQSTIVTRQIGVEYKCFRTVSMYMEGYWNIVVVLICQKYVRFLEGIVMYSEGICIHMYIKT